VVEKLRKSYKDLDVLKGVDFSVARGSVLALLGPNGAGKTTTIKILSTLLYPDGGQAFINGYDVVKEPARVKSSIGLTGQFAAVDDYLTGEENLQMMGRLYRMRSADTRRRVGELLEQFDLLEASKRPVKTYSGGMKRRIDLAMSLIASPPILFLDEPTTGLDPRSRLTMWESIEELVAGGTTILLTTQYMDEADRLADSIVVIDNGKVIADGTADTLKSRVGSDRVEFVIAAGSDFGRAKKTISVTDMQIDEKRRTLSIAAKNGVTDLKQALDRLETAKIRVESVSMHRPTLDDVFLSLTGHAASVEVDEPTIQKNTSSRKEGKK
jgi:ABC-2 type transport system ATP-binding protein